MAETTSSELADGPVLGVINKRIRALRKKYNRILQMEESLSQGKSLNIEQEETFRSKPLIVAAIDELEKLKHPISLALSEEISTALRQHQLNPQPTNSSEEVEKDGEKVEVDDGKDDGNLEAVKDVLNLLYFASMFDVKHQSNFTATMLARTHERGCCLTYDYVTDDDNADLLGERDLDLLSMLGGLLISRPVNSSLSHKNAISSCIEHAMLWLSNADRPIEPHSDITYAGLRQKLNKIMASDYFTTSPEMKAPAEVAAYGTFQVPVQGPVVSVNWADQPEASHVQYEQKDAGMVNALGNGNYNNQSDAADEHYQGDEGEGHLEFHGQTEQLESPHEEKEQTSAEFEKGQQYVPRRSYQNLRGGGGSRGRGVSSGGHRGYPNGRGGRISGRGSTYANGRNYSYEQAGNGYPRNNYSRGRGRQGAGFNHNNQVGGEA